MEPDVANAAQLSSVPQLWYLTKECIILCLFDKDVSDGEKAEMAAKLVAVPQQESFPSGKPKFPSKSTISVTSKLPDFIGPRSWLAFSLLGASHEWLHLPLDQWVQDDDFNSMSNIMADMAVTNDAAERVFKDVTECSDAARDGQMRGRIIITVTCAHRMHAPSLLKRELDEI